MVNLNELYILNLALDGRDIFMLPKFTNIRMTNLLGSSIYSSLVEKELMQDAENFTQEGVILLKKIEQYKQAKKYVKLGPVILGIYNETNAIALIIDWQVNSCDFKRIEFENIMEQLYPTYPFLNMNYDIDFIPEVEEQISYDELKDTFSLKFDNALYLSTLDRKMLIAKNNDIVTNELLFYYEGVNYCYDFNLERLTTCSTIQLQDIIKKRVTL